MQRNATSANNNGPAASSSEASCSGSEEILRLTRQRIAQTHSLVQQTAERLAALDRLQLRLSLKERQLFERCVQQREALQRLRNRLTPGTRLPGDAPGLL